MQTYGVRRLIRAQLHDVEGEIADATRLIEIEGGKSWYWFTLRADAYEKQKRYDLALADIDKAISVGKENASLLSSRAQLQNLLGNTEKAYENFERAIALDPTNAFVLQDRAKVRFDHGDDAGAIADYGGAIALQPTYSWLYYSRALVHERAGDFQAALSDLTKASTLSPDSRNFVRMQSIVRFDLGDYSASAADALKAVELGSDAYIMLRRAVIQGRLGHGSVYRLDRVRSALSDIGWGVKDAVDDIRFDLDPRLDNRSLA